MVTNGAGLNDARRSKLAAYRVLIVDDDPVLVDALRELLNEEGYSVEGYTEPSRALDRLLREDRPELVLLDYVMPSMNGEQFLEALDGAGIRVPVVLFTAMNDSQLPRRASHVASVIKKPFDLDCLLAVLDRLRTSAA
jgi:CheY-like chemotaxis protein